jgi:hypothetical protein
MIVSSTVTKPAEVRTFREALSRQAMLLNAITVTACSDESGVAVLLAACSC